MKMVKHLEKGSQIFCNRVKYNDINTVICAFYTVFIYSFLFCKGINNSRRGTQDKRHQQRMRVLGSKENEKNAIKRE